MSSSTRAVKKQNEFAHLTSKFNCDERGIGILIDDPDAVEKVNQILHQSSRWIVGRMGIPYHARNINIISVVVDAPQDEISRMSGLIGKLSGVTAKIAYAKLPNHEA